jgi:anti-sigma regulatory factor (Ser/Thr protein kinase)
MIHLDIYNLEYASSLSVFQGLVEDYSCIECEISFRADHTQSKIIRDILGKIFDENHIYAPWRGRFVLIADELVNNAIEHGSQPGDRDICIIRAHRKDNTSFSIGIEVHDTGKGKDSKNAKRMTEIKKEKSRNNEVSMEKRGRGLFQITEKLVDTLTFSESPSG